MLYQALPEKPLETLTTEFGCFPRSVMASGITMNNIQNRSELRHTSKANASIKSYVDHKYVYVYEVGFRILALKS